MIAQVLMPLLPRNTGDNLGVNSSMKNHCKENIYLVAGKMCFGSPRH
ncbi:hypothetical protein HMPREF0299_5325 [Corynebacterium matruchotii ATCC 14266]|uniref:Uncharacterized protein n=1 Tax=Corynebacterium matruchotii ATCC 14266 TaxID=553207 RepID=E0DI15_9CORY|nr:hypothetical protein HMPREF0299_5325 [Corynebacterium matruchotii ATCC 14266]